MKRQRTPNVTGRAYCSHCDNIGIVEICRGGEMGDHSPTAAPCPMCIQGLLAERKILSSEDEYWTPQRLATTTWERGYSFRHDRHCRFAREGDEYSCGRPAAGAYCDFHDLESNRVVRRSGDVGAIVKGLAS